jgi:dimethylargininase
MRPDSPTDQEPWGANTLLINAALMVAKSASQTAELLPDRGFNVSVVDISELQKAEAGLTCLSLVYRNAAM